MRSRFIATVNRVETVKKLKRTFKELGGLGPTVQVRQADDNVKSVEESDVILLWCVPFPNPLSSANGTQLQASTRRSPPHGPWHERRARGQAAHLHPRRNDHLDDARLGPR